MRRNALKVQEGFQNFLYRCTTNEGVDLGLKLFRYGSIVLHPEAKMAHNHVPGGRVNSDILAEDNFYNRFQILRKTLLKSYASVE